MKKGSLFLKELSTINCQLSIIPYSLPFRRPAGTSRGIYTVRKGYYVIIHSLDNPSRWGIGECAPLPDLSIDAITDYEYVLGKACRLLEKDRILDIGSLRPYPSILFGLETALQHFERESYALWNTPFSGGERGIPINGLIWMGDYHYMQEQIKTKIEAGFHCIKLKIGAIDFEKEQELLKQIRKQFTAQDIEIRVDANGAFSPTDVLDKLNRLASLDIHSIEQPIRAGQWDEMAELTQITPIPIALDEELIGNYSLDEKQKLLSYIRPQYIILKPSLHGALTGCREWIEEAEKREIGWWITSALETNIGLNAIAQWCATWDNPLPQGLGTGLLFTDNMEVPLSIKQDQLWFNPKEQFLPSSYHQLYFPSTRTSDNPYGNYYLTNNKQDLITLPGSLPTKEAAVFFSEWHNEKRPYITVRTSGSTGTPKPFSARKEFMVQSAHTTCEFFKLKWNDLALLCLPMQYIAGKMMVVRGMISSLRLIIQEPSGHPLKEESRELDFAAMTPMQVYNSLQSPTERERLKKIKKLLIGGSAIDPEMEKELRPFPGEIYASYGMTETLSHIALRRINGPEASDYYTPFKSVKLSLSEEGTLVIDAPLVCEEILITNDLAEIREDGTFRIMGRKDNVINSGSIKIQIEELENKLRSIISANFVITSVPHPQLGEAVALLIEEDTNDRTLSFDSLPVYQRPKFILRTSHIPLTGNGKIDRSACKNLAIQLIKSL